MLGKDQVGGGFKRLNFDCAVIIFSNLTPIDVIRCGQASRTLREWAFWFMSSEGLRRRHFPYFTDEGSFDNDTLSPVKRYARFTRIQRSFKEGRPSSVLKFVGAKELKSRGDYAAWIFGSWVLYHQLRNKPGGKSCRRIQPLSKLPLTVCPPSPGHAPFAPHFIDVNAKGYLFVRVGIEERCSRRIESTHDMVFSLSGTKLLWHHDRDVDGLPELQPLHIGKERVYYITMFARPELIAYDIRSGRQVYRSPLPEKIDNNSRCPEFNFIFDEDHEFLAYVSQECSRSSPPIHIVLINGANGHVSQEIEVPDASWPLELKEQPNVAAFALESKKQNFLNGRYDLMIFDKYSLQADGLFTLASRDLFALNGSATPDRTFIYVDPFRLLAFAMVDATSDSTIPRVLELKKLSDTNLRGKIEAELGGKGVREKVHNWFTSAATGCITLPSKTAGSNIRCPLKVRGIETHLASKISFWGQRGIFFYVNGYQPRNSDTIYALDFTPKASNTHSGAYGT
ncbi:hypothetical protein AJ78_03966 [Emergomyces pasteurianus Ep9510]|uniref:F-box domain-containing protein n=1 Tax=Emergomyces pasteurianus Ep9510 TaxID=1447872 RepID=A0A1J9QI39_9EURO|nr:hypothetical protein AJ78_03966 [Emergomyces pasteurianus Ep9510]